MQLVKVVDGNYQSPDIFPCLDFMSRRKPSRSQLAIVGRNGEAKGRPIAKKHLDFGDRWSYSPALESEQLH